MGLQRGIGAVVTDVDGTIVGHDGTPSQATVHAVASLHALGIPLIVATARTPAGVAMLASLRPYLTTAVCCTGAIGWSPDRARLVWQEDLRPSVVRQIVEFVTGELPGGAVAAYDGQQWVTTDTYPGLRGRPPRGPNRTAPPVEIADVRACTMAICHSHLDAGQVTTLLRARIPDLAAALSHADPGLLDITPPAIDKATGVARALAALGIDPGHTVGFGDMPNDLSMLGLVGYPIAVANAHPDVIAAAVTVTASVDDDGFAQALGAIGVTAGSTLTPPPTTHRPEAAHPARLDSA